MGNSLISIIIPVFNRAHLVGETLDSIKNQTYTNWECIVVDDGSTDTTAELLEFYVQRDNRIKFYSRPVEKLKGANACRNFGFEKSAGDFINWFDSDDIMKPDNLKSKLEAFSPEVDFVIGNSLNFDINGNTSRPYPLNYQLPITPENYIKGLIGWITNDVLIRRKKVLVRFNEKLKSGQEYNFFSRLLYFTSKGKYLKKDVVMRRVHFDSIQQRTGNKEYEKEYFYNQSILLMDLQNCASEKIVNWSLKRLIRFSYNSTRKKSIGKMQKKVMTLLFQYKRFRVLFLYQTWIISNLISGKGYKFIRQSYKFLD